jgi:hypothetical protein
VAESLHCYCIMTHSDVSNNTRNGEVCALGGAPGGWGRGGGCRRVNTTGKKAIKREVKKLKAERKSGGTISLL